MVYCRSKHFIVTGALVFLAGISGCAAIEVYPGFRPGMEGVVYRLPRGVLLVSVPVVRTDYATTELTSFAGSTDGGFANLPLIEVPDGLGNHPNKTTSFAFSAPSIESAVEPDPDHAYFIRIKGGPSQNRTLKLSLNRLGVMTDVDSHVQDKKLELALAAIESAARIGGGFLGAGAAPEAGVISDDQVPPATGPEAKAIALRRALASIREARNEWLRRLESSNPEALSAGLSVFDAQEKAIVAEFVKKTTKVVPLVFEVRPRESANGGAKTCALVKLHNKNGIVSIMPKPDDQIIAPDAVPADGKTGGAVAGELSQIEIRICANSAYEGVNGLRRIDKGPTGFVYRIPGAVDVSLVEKKDGALVRSRFASTFQIPQLGTVAALPRHAGLSPDNRLSLTLYEDAGALKTLNVESKAIDPETIRGFGANVSEPIAAMVAARAGSVEKPSKIARMTTRAKELAELVVAYKTLGIPLPIVPDPASDAP